MSKDIVFFSNFCDYSKEVIQKINNTPLKDQITLVCVDDKNIQLPDFIQAVPTVFLINEKKILIDDDIETWFNSKTNSNQGQGSGDERLLSRKDLRSIGSICEILEASMQINFLCLLKE